MIYGKPIKKLESKYNFNLFEDIVFASNNRVSFVIDLNEKNLPIYVFKGDLAAISLPQFETIDLRDFLNFIEADNKLAEIEGRNNFIETIKRKFKYFEKDLYLWIPIKRTNNEPIWLYVGLDRIKHNDSHFVTGQVMQIYNTTPNSIIHYQKTYQDSLTNLFTREALKMHLDFLTNTNDSYVMFLDIDGFKKVNDLYGHDVGDQFLISIANHFINNWEHNVLYYRLGGDEFFVYCYDHNEDDIIKRAQKLINDIENLNPIAKELKVSVSIGIVKITDNNNGYHRLLNLSDNAMYLSKAKGTGNYTILKEDQ